MRPIAMRAALRGPGRRGPIGIRLNGRALLYNLSPLRDYTPASLPPVAVIRLRMWVEAHRRMRISPHSSTITAPQRR